MSYQAIAQSPFQETLRRRKLRKLVQGPDSGNTTKLTTWLRNEKYSNG